MVRTLGMPRLFSLVLCVLLLMAAAVAGAVEKPKDYPRRPVTVIVPFGAGGGADQMARTLLQPVSKIMKTPVLVVNKPGGNATLGFNDFWVAPADGYTLLQYNDDCVTHFVSGLFQQNPTKEYLPITIGMVVYSQIYIRPNDPRFHDWESFLAYAKAHPGQVTLANIAQRGNMEEVQGVQLETAAGIKFNQISFDKPSERYSALVGGHVDALLEQPGDVAPYLKSHDMKAIFSFTDTRPAEFADSPCLKELNKNARNVYKVRGFFMKADMPKDRQLYLREVFKQAFESPEFQAYISDKYPMDTKYRSFEDCVELINGITATYMEIYKELGYARAQ